MDGSDGSNEETNSSCDTSDNTDVHDGYDEQFKSEDEFADESHTVFDAEHEKRSGSVDTASGKKHVYNETKPFNSSDYDSKVENRDPNYGNSIDLDDDNVDNNLDKMDVNNFQNIDPRKPQDYKVEFFPAQRVEDFRAIDIDVVTREEWGALPRPSEEVPLKHKIPLIHMEYHTGTDSCFTKEDCIQKVREIQKRHIEQRGLSDIQYNFLIGGDGNAYEGRGWFVQPPSTNEVPKYTGRYMEVAYIGDYRVEMQTDELMRGQFSLIKIGLEKNYIDRMFNFIIKQLDLPKT